MLGDRKRRLDAGSQAFSQVLGLQVERRAFQNNPDADKRKLARWQSSLRKQAGDNGDAAAPAAKPVSADREAPASAAAASAVRPSGRSRAWTLERFVVLEPGGQRCVVRPVTEGDAQLLRAFGADGLSERSRRFFAPYNWDAASLDDELAGAIANSLSQRRRSMRKTAAGAARIGETVRGSHGGGTGDEAGMARGTLSSGARCHTPHSLARRDLHLVAVADGRVVGYGFLWSVGCDDLPEVGLAIAQVETRFGRGAAPRPLRSTRGA